MAKRRIPIEVEGLSHGTNPIPLAIKVGDHLISSALMGTDRVNHKMAESYEEQVENLFSNIRAVLDAADATPENIVKLNFYLSPGRDRVLINEHWVKLFPDPDDRPVRQVIVMDLPFPGVFIQGVFEALLD